MGWGATPESCMGFVCLKSHLCCSGNEQRHVHYPRTCFATWKQIASDSLSLSHLKKQKKKKTNKQTKVLLWANPTNNERIRSLWCPSGAFSSNFSGWLAPLAFFASFSTYSGEALVSGWPWSLSLSLSLPFSTVHACSIPKGYVHE